VNDVTVTDEGARISSADLTAEGTIKLSFGRKRHILVKPT
jgi:tyrosyl-tRNA synthetase